MAKRKRLTPAPMTGPMLGPDQVAESPALETKALNGWVGIRSTNNRPPIADVTGEAAARSAFEEVAQELRAAKAEGRMITRLELDAVDETHLVRDRLAVNEDDMADLCDSLHARGQQTPIEVVDLGAGRYGLISGWRRLMALRRLQTETGEDRFAQVQALIRAPDSAAEAYCAMVEENEIRADLSFYERARVAVKAVEQEVFSDTKTAIQTLFSAARAPKRSKIVAFTALVEALDDTLRWPASIPEKLGLSLSALLREDRRFGAQVRNRLHLARAEDPAGERSALEQALREATARPEAPAPLPDVVPGVALQAGRGKITLSGTGVDAALIEDLKLWLTERAEISQDPES